MTDTTHVAFLRLLLAVAEHDNVRAHRILDDSDLVELSHYLAHRFCLLFQDEAEKFLEDIRHDLKSLGVEA